LALIYKRIRAGGTFPGLMSRQFKRARRPKLYDGNTSDGQGSLPVRLLSLPLSRTALKVNAKLVSMSDAAGTVYSVGTLFVCYACIYASDLLPQRPERRIYKNHINVFLFLRKKRFLHITVYVPLQSTRGSPK